MTHHPAENVGQHFHEGHPTQDDEERLRETLAQVVLTDLRAGRQQLTPGAQTALRILAESLDERLPVPGEPQQIAAERRPVGAEDEPARRPLRRVGTVVGVGTGIAAIAAGALFLVSAGDDSPAGQQHPAAVVAAPSSPAESAAPAVPGAGSPSPSPVVPSPAPPSPDSSASAVASHHAGDVRSPVPPADRPAPATASPRRTTAGRPPVAPPHPAGQGRPTDGPAANNGGAAAPRAPAAADSSSAADPSAAAPVPGTAPSSSPSPSTTSSAPSSSAPSTQAATTPSLTTSHPSGSTTSAPPTTPSYAAATGSEGAPVPAGGDG